MLLGGDELGRTQQGNNNAYCQDNEISWYDWSAADGDLLAFTSTLVKFRRAHPVFRRRQYATGVDVSELGWFTPGGTPMTQADWDDASALAIGVYLDGSRDPDLDADGQPLVDDDFLVLVNAWWEPLEFAIPATGDGQQWQKEIDTFDPADAAGASLGAGEKVPVGPRSVVVLRRPPGVKRERDQPGQATGRVLTGGECPELPHRPGVAPRAMGVQTRPTGMPHQPRSGCACAPSERVLQLLESPGVDGLRAAS